MSTDYKCHKIRKRDNNISSRKINLSSYHKFLYNLRKHLENFTLVSFKEKLPTKITHNIDGFLPFTSSEQSAN